MYNPSDQYLKKSQDSYRKSKTKIIIGNKEYDSAYYLKSYPKFSHSNSTMIGGFPSKDVTFSMINKDTDKIDILNNEIYIYKGLVLDDNSVEWIPQGIFIASPENIETSASGNEISIKATDKTILTEIRRIDNLHYPCTELIYIKDVVKQCDLELESEDFPFSDHILNERPNYDENTTYCREIISRFAEERGCIAIMSRNGKVWIKPRTDTGVKIYNYQYKKMPSCEEIYGPIDSVSLGKENINDSIIYPSKDELPNPKFTWSINDNPFLDLIRQERIIDVYNTIHNLSIVPFKVESCLDNYCLDINDCIEIQLKNGDWITTTILSYATSNRLMCDISADVQNKKLVNHNLAGSVKKEFNQVKLDVDHVKKQITILAEDVKQSGIPRYSEAPSDAKEEDIYLNTTDNIIYIYKNGEWKPTSIDPASLEDYWTKEETRAEIDVTANEIKLGVSQSQEDIEGLKKQSNELSAKIDGLINTKTSVGGFNLLRNAILAFGNEFWEGEVKQFSNTETQNESGQKSGWLLQNSVATQTVQVKNGMYTLSCIYRKIIELSNCKIIINDVEYPINETEYTEFSQTFDVKEHSIKISIVSDTNDSAYLLNLMLNEGEVKQPYSNNANETVTDTVKIGQGLEITSSIVNTKLNADADGVRIKNVNNNETVTEFTDKGTKTKELIVEGNSQITGLLFKDIDGQTWISRM